MPALPGFPALPYILPIVMLVASNLFMTFAWYGHPRYPGKPLLLVILVSWGSALFEYCLAVPANRIGHQVYTVAELKTIQEIVTLTVFAAFSVFWLGERFTLSYFVGFCLIAAGAFFIFRNPLG